MSFRCRKCSVDVVSAEYVPRPRSTLKNTWALSVMGPALVLAWLKMTLSRILHFLDAAPRPRREGKWSQLCLQKQRLLFQIIVKEMEISLL